MMFKMKRKSEPELEPAKDVASKHRSTFKLFVVAFVAVFFFQAVSEIVTSTRGCGFQTMVLKSHRDIQIAFSVRNDNDTEVPSLGNETIGDADKAVEAQPFELYEWELKSLPTENTTHGGACDRPDGVGKECCIGSYSVGGGIKWDKRFRCKGMDHDELARDVTELLGSDNCDLCRVLALAAEYNQSIALWGDSVQNQIWSGLVCEIQRRGYDIVSRNFTQVQWDENVCEGMFCLKEVDEIVVQVGHRTATLRMYFQYMLVEKDNSVYNVTRDIVATNDILLFNFGLHIRDYEGRREILTERMSTLLERVKEHGNLSLLIYRETSAQNFDSPSNGDYWTRDRDGKHQCTNMRYGHNARWRLGVVENAAKNQSYELLHVTPVDVKQTFRPPRQNIPPSGLRRSNNHTITSPKTPSLHVFPFWDFTANMWHMHPFHEGDGECTHFCSTPILWMPVWRYLRVSMEDKFFGDGVHDYVARL